MADAPSSAGPPHMAAQRPPASPNRPPPPSPQQTNPIRWSLSLGGGGGLSAFGAGYFDDAGDVPGTPVLFFALQGRFRPEDASLELTKVLPHTPHHTAHGTRRTALVPPRPPPA